MMALPADAVQRIAEADGGGGLAFAGRRRADRGHQDQLAVFVTGGVVSSLGKGIAAASLGAILEARGLKISMVKLDPYINVDPGTMSPFQHGEVFVTADGTETDLDLGHYERFVRTTTSAHSNFTTGRIYERVIAQGAPRRVPRRDGAGHPAHHRRDQALHQAGRRRRRRLHGRDRRHGRRHRVAAVPRGHPPDAASSSAANTACTCT
jgi:hypothetical protein